jgi:ketosteroid isomerase-like protein
MKIHLILTFAGLASCTGFAQQTPATPEVTRPPLETNGLDTKTAAWSTLRDQLIAGSKKHDQGFLNGDPAALVSGWADNAVQVNDDGPIYGKEAVKEHFEELFKHVHFIKHVATFDQDSPHLSPSGDTFWASGDWVVSTEGTTPSGQHFGPTDEKGFFTVIFVREVDEWKVALEIWNRLKSYK